MLAPARHRLLLEFLNQKGSVRTIEVANYLNVTEETVRRDFEKLEKEGTLLRAHGGAVRVEAPQQETPFKDRATKNAPAKKVIAQAAVHKVSPGQIIFLDASTTVQQLARLIPDFPLTVLTNSLQIPEFFANKPAIDVILLGGHLRTSSRSCVGYPAELTSDLYRIDSAFVSCRGINPQLGLSEATEDQARLKRHLLNRASSLFLLADTSKIEARSTFYFAKNSEIDVWFTEKAPTSAVDLQMKRDGVTIEIGTES
jgi:DeoR/GlpR family transcriptional regulator of sugar metabolism